METYIEKRACQRFEIPDATVRFKKGGFLQNCRNFSEKKELVNVSKGGVCFLINEEVQVGDKIVINLYLSNDVIPCIKGSVAWWGSGLGGTQVGVQFAPFSKGNGYNSIETLDILRSLEAIYLAHKKFE